MGHAGLPFTDQRARGGLHHDARADPAGVRAHALELDLQDSLTRYRVMVVAVDDSGRGFGSGESSITARLPLMVSKPLVNEAEDELLFYAKQGSRKQLVSVGVKGTSF